MTARYNGYFNANVLYNESIAKLNDQHQDNYNKLLDVYEYMVADNPQAVAGDLDKAIEKVTVVVSLHRVSHWTDDCYLLFGQSQFVKQEYEAAEETFLYLTEEYSPEAMAEREAALKKGSKKKRKKKKRKKSSSKKKKSSSSKKKTSAKTKKDNAKEKEDKAKSQAKKRKDYNKEVKRRKKEREKAKAKALEVARAKKAAEKAKKEAGEPVVEEKVVTTPVPTPKPEKKEKVSKKKIDDSDEKPEKYILKHRPAYQDGMLWLARTYVARDKYDEARDIFMDLYLDPMTHKSVKRDLAPAFADFYIKQKEYEEAIPHLEEAIELEKDRQKKARYAYIIAQLHQTASRGDDAFAYFEKAMKYSNSYEMEFSSRLNMAQNAYINGQATPEQAKKTLEKMLKDGKNIDYKDQIYYAMANIDLKTNNKEGAIENYRLSLQNSTGNKAQMAESYLQLAYLYFEGENYVNAKNYFDSTMTALPNTDERYKEVEKYATSLTDIAKNIQVITFQDSLLAISELSEADKKQLAYDIKKAENDKRLEELKRRAGESEPAKPRRSIGPPRSASQQASTWWAYNDKNLKKGKRSFERRWGNRKLEDNWRRSSRQSIDQEIEGEDVESLAEKEITEEDLKKILRNVPNSPQQKTAANKKIQDAMMALGRLYREKLDNNEKTIEILEQLLERYPKTEHELDAWYYLYLAHTDLNKRSPAQAYYDKIVTNYPTTTYARVLEDPNFLVESKAKEKKLINYYDETYTVFEKGQFKKAFDRVGKVGELFGARNKLQSKFALLQAMCVGNLEGKPAYVSSLKEVVAKHPDTDEQKRAKEILRLLGEGGSIALPKQEGTDESGTKEVDESIFKFDPNKVHYVIVALDGEKLPLTKAKTDAAAYNRQFHKLDRLRLSNVFLGADTKAPILVVRRFKKKDAAMKYYDGIMKNKTKFLGNNSHYEVFPVTQHNYRQILKTKSLEGYRAFFESNYLK